MDSKNRRASANNKTERMHNFFSRFFPQKYSEEALTGIIFSLFDRFILKLDSHSYCQDCRKFEISKTLQISRKINVVFYQA